MPGAKRFQPLCFGQKAALIDAGGAGALRTEYGCKIVARRLDAGILCEGHFGVVHGRQEVRDFICSFLDR